MTLPANVTRFLFEIPSLASTQAQALRVVDFEGRSGVSELFYCSVGVACEDAEIDLQSLIGKSARLTLFDERSPHYIHGEIVQARQGEKGKRYTLYQIMLAPKLSFLQYRQNYRVFQDASTPEIIKSIMKDAGIQSDQVEWNLTEQYEAKPYCTQYAESDLNFIQRLMEEAGLYFHFEHKHDRHLLVISDNIARFRPIAGKASVRFKERTGMVASEESIFEFRSQVAIQSGKVALRDYSHEKSRQRLQSTQQANTHRELEQYQYLNHYTQSAQGKRLVQVRLQAQSAQIETVFGVTDCQRLVVGARFSLADHPVNGFNREYVLLSTEFQGKQPQSLAEGASGEGSQFTVSFRGIPSNVEYRSPFVTPLPKLEGAQTAWVTGPAGEEIYTDALGRVKVQFHWDREGAFDQKSSCWVRVCQSVAGNKWGAMVIPRVGQEVLVSFINGNPDRPIITRILYNGANKVPYSLPGNKTKTVFKSHSSPGGGGFNEVQLEDKKGSENVRLRAEKDIELSVNNDWREHIAQQQHIKVGKSAYSQVEGDANRRVDGNEHIDVGKGLSENVGQGSQIKINGSHTEQAGKVVSLKAGMTLVIQAGIELTLKAGAGIVKLDPSGVTIKGPMVKINTGGAAQPGQPASPVAPGDAIAAEPGSGPGKASKPAQSN